MYEVTRLLRFEGLLLELWSWFTIMFGTNSVIFTQKKFRPPTLHFGLFLAQFRDPHYPWFGTWPAPFHHSDSVIEDENGREVR